MKQFRKKPQYVPRLDQGFRPMALENAAYREALEKSSQVEEVKVSIERNNGYCSTTTVKIFGEDSGYCEDTVVYIDRLVKSLLWIKGGYKILFAGPDYLFQHLKDVYQKGKEREFDALFMGKVYGKEFCVEKKGFDEIPDSKEEEKKIGRNLDGCRIGFDAGGSDRKVSAVIDGEPIYSEEVVWHPKITEDPTYHYQGILDSIQRAAEKLPKVDAIGISAAGIYIDNEVKAASLFRVIPEKEFDEKVKKIFFEVVKEIGDIPFEVANDGDVTALAGAMDLNENNILGIAMGTSEAVGYVNEEGNITGWLNELAFVPVDYSEEAIVDEWSQDRGVGVSYFSQDAVIKLAPAANIHLEESLSPAEKLKVVQDLVEKEDPRAYEIFETIGIYLGYSLAYYSDFYDMKKVLLLGRVMSGEGGERMIQKANEVIAKEFPKLYEKITLVTPDEKAKRVGQSIAAASLVSL
ncbi:ROK family protein [Tindallia magadiensis]|nr:ROK family protein [Tindallia magadiensis]